MSKASALLLEELGYLAQVEQIAVMGETIA
jgi:hypothetical protein